MYFPVFLPTVFVDQIDSAVLTPSVDVVIPQPDLFDLGGPFRVCLKKKDLLEILDLLLLSSGSD